jgi:hypothetical protein
MSTDEAALAAAVKERGRVALQKRLRGDLPEAHKKEQGALPRDQGQGEPKKPPPKKAAQQPFSVAHMAFMRALLAHPQYAFDCNRFLERVSHSGVSALIKDIQSAVHDNGDLAGSELLAVLPLRPVYAPIVARLRVDSVRFGFDVSEAQTQRAIRDFESHLKGDTVVSRIQALLSDQEAAELAGDMALWKELNEERQRLVEARNLEAKKGVDESATHAEPDPPATPQAFSFAAGGELAALAAIDPAPLSEGGMPPPQPGLEADEGPDDAALDGEEWDEDFF